LRSRAHEQRAKDVEATPTSLVVELFLNGAGRGPMETVE